MSEETSTQADYIKDCRKPCKYGAKCYQRNPQHLSKFKHPPKKDDSEVNGSLKKRKSDESTSEVSLEIPPTKNRKLDTVKIPRCSKSRSPSPHISPVSSPSSSLESPGKQHVKKSDEPKNASFADDDDEEELPSDPTNIRDSIKQKFLMEMPDDFYNFWEFCKDINESDPLNALSQCGIRLVGPYDVLAGTALRPRTQSRYLCHWRYYYDPPELQTILSCGTKGHHIGYFRDSPGDAPVFLASMSSIRPGIVAHEGDNIFDAVRVYCLETEGSANPFQQRFYSKIIKKLQAAAIKYNCKLDTKADAIKRRRKHVVCQSFHGAGIVVPLDKKTQVGYREIPETNASLRRMLQRVVEAKTDDSRQVVFADVQELMTNAQWATDEGDFGMGLELGMALFINGSPFFHKAAAHLMGVAYSLLNRDAFSAILQAHLKNRRKGDQLSAFS